jgi:hypothetical protein
MLTYLPQIPWNKYSEEQIQSLLELFFEYTGYKIYNQHQIQRAIEDGADLILSKRGRSDIAIAIKIKPDKKDSYQLIELGRRKEKEKWYIYFNQPTPSFKKEMKRHKKIKFFDSLSLNNFLFRQNEDLYISFLLDNTPIIYSTIQIQFHLALYYDKSDKQKKAIKKIQELDKESLSILWRLKDDTSSLHKAFRSQQTLFENIETEEHDVKKTLLILRGYLSFLKEFNKYAKNVDTLLEGFYQKKKQIFDTVIKRTRIRSNWLGIFHFKPAVPIFAKEISEDRKKMQKQIDKLFNKVEKLKGLYHQNIKQDKCFNQKFIPYILSDHSRIMASFYNDVESIIDDIFSYGLFDNESTVDMLVKKPSDNLPPFLNINEDYFSDNSYNKKE